MKEIADEILVELKDNLLDKWYPLVIDTEHGGYFSNISFDWKLEEVQDKMIVSQARHIWTLSKAYELFSIEDYKEYALHGFRFLRDNMWDNEYGGFFQIRSRNGKLTSAENWLDEKRIYGNAFAIYGLAALYKITNNKEVLDLAIKTFTWMEEKAHDNLNKGYFQFLTREGERFGQNSDYRTKASDKNEAGLKDQNSSIHLLEAFTELYSVWPNAIVKERLKELLELIRDKLTTEKGYLNLFFHEDWSHVSFKTASKKERENNYGLDHVSFGHDYETAFLMMEASHALGLEHDHKTLNASKKMLDHALENGWDEKLGGFFDEGYYFEGSEKCKIIKDTKTWWCQAEGLNILLIFSILFPNNSYKENFKKLWNYVNHYLLDEKNKGWYWGSIEKEPNMINEPKGSIWKACYHDGRSLINCISMLGNDNSNINVTNGLARKVTESKIFITHWKKTADENI